MFPLRTSPDWNSGGSCKEKKNAIGRGHDHPCERLWVPFLAKRTNPTLKLDRSTRTRSLDTDSTYIKRP
jgi:hypothetical protein